MLKKLNHLKPKLLKRNFNFQSVLPNFPKSNYTFAYGSGAFQQSNYQNKDLNMLDLVFVVDNLERFHSENLDLNRKHYSLINRLLGSSNIAKIQRKYGSKVWWHPYIEGQLPKQSIKYGIVEMSDFEKDLNIWSDLYISGRLHKPIKQHYPNSKYRDKIAKLIHENRIAALNTALLTLPERFNERELYIKIASLSYFGDIRGKHFEDRSKVEKIVDGSFEEFKNIYRPILESYDIAKLNIDYENDEIDQDLSSITILKKLNFCPLNLQIEIGKAAAKEYRQYMDTEEILRTVAKHPIPWEFINGGLENIIKRKTLQNTALSWWSAGFFKGLKYVYIKWTKSKIS